MSESKPEVEVRHGWPHYYWRKDPSVCGPTVLGLLERGVPRRLSREGFWSYMLCGAVQEPYTLIEDVYSEVQPPAFDVRAAFRFSTAGPRMEEVQAAVTVAVEKCVRDCLERNGGTPCAFLSGGIDSGALVSVMRNVLGPDAEIRTCCVVHEDPRTDERRWARLTAERNHTRHEEFLLTGASFVRLVGEALDCYDQPSVDGINSYIACKFASEAGFRNVVSGEGGDELFAGYGQFANPRRAYSAARLLSAAGLRGTAFANVLGRFLVRFATREKVKKLGQLMSSACDPYFLTRRQFDPDWVARLVSGRTQAAQPPELYDGMRRSCGTDATFGDDVINRCSWMEVRHNLRSMYVRDGVQMSAPFGLNVETPLLSDELVQLLFSIPGSFKCDPKISKPLLVRAARGGLPEACVTKKKQGFALPFDRYFKTEMRGALEEFATTGGTGFFDQGELARIWRLYLAGKTSWMRVWQPYVLDHWLGRNRVNW